MSPLAHAAALPEPLGLRDFAPGTLVLRDVEVDGDTPKEHISVFGDDIWHLHPMALNPAAARFTVDFTSSPLLYQQTLKRLVWTLINHRTPVEMLQRRTTMRTRLAAETIHSVFRAGMRPFVCWLDEHGISQLCDAGDDVLAAYAAHVAGLSESRDRKAHRLSIVTRIWLLAPYLPAEDRIAQPPWEPHGPEDLIGPARSYPENRTRPIHPQTMSTVLVWALRFVQDFSDDILQAAQQRNAIIAEPRRRMQRGDNAKLQNYLDDLRRSGGALPGRINRSGRLELAGQYLAAKLDISYNALRRVHSSGVPIQAGAPLDTPTSGRIHDEPWTETIDFYEADHLVRLLAAACLIVTAYLSGMRRQECLALRRGCCRPARDDGPTAAGFEIVGRTFKTAVDAEGNTIPGGAVRDHPWYVIEPVAAAVSVMERLHPHDMVFAGAAFNPTLSGDRALARTSISVVIEQFIGWCNDAAARIGRPDEAIPEDPDGPITMQRFRRTLAWFIYRLPGGMVSLGIQYGHLEPLVTAGYGSRVSAQLRDVFPMEEALARFEHLANAADRRDAGEHVSGPAAGRYTEGIDHFVATYPGRFLPPKGYKQLLANPKLRIFDNGLQPVACCYDATKALCHPDNQRKPDIRRSPDLTRCDPRCGNIARTDSHIDEIRVEINHLTEQRSSPMTPEPMYHAYGQRIDMLQDIIDTHQRTRIRPDPPPDTEPQ